MPIKIKIIAPINSNAFNHIIAKAVQPVLNDNISIDVENISKGTSSIQSRFDRTTNAPHVVALAKQAESDGFDGIFVSDMDYCGVEEIREVVNIPVVCAFRASAFTAMMLSNRFSIITILESVADMQRDHTHTFGINSSLASVRVVNIPVHSLNKDHTNIVNEVYNESLKAIQQDEARSIILGCTGFIGVAKKVQEALKKNGYDIPVIDPNCAAISHLLLLIQNQLYQSRLTYHYSNINEFASV